ncbi:MAG: TfoX/Sxy family protein [Kiritimatiellales bacterium]|nr:TfoX/Sxy family protein [Kiritimatiellales bacterium]
MPISDEFIAYVLDQFSGWGGVSACKMFGGAGLYRGEKMFGLVADDTAYLKVDDTNRAQFIQAGSLPFKPYPGKAMTMSYYEIPPEVLEDPEQLAAWAKQSLDIQNKGK